VVFCFVFFVVPCIHEAVNAYAISRMSKGVETCNHADAEAASGKSFMDLKAEPGVADTDNFTKQAAAGLPSTKGVQGGLREAVSPTRDRMAQALR
jgi:hypothetical protein